MKTLCESRALPKRANMKSSTLLKKALESALDDLKATNIISIDVDQLTSLTDYMIIATGTSGRHVNAIADKLIRAMKGKQIALGIEGDLENEWVLVDFGDAVVHIMQQRTRDFYQLEKLWSSQHHAHLAVV